MLAQLLTIGLLMLFSAMLPGPDFALVTQNTIRHSRRAGIFTSLGITTAVTIHLTYCLLGLALVISQSVVIFNIIKYLGAAYLIYLGIKSLLAKQLVHLESDQKGIKKHQISDFTAFQQGFLCNVLNPKAAMFFLALFTVILKPNTSWYFETIVVVEILILVMAWFSTLTFILSHPRIMKMLEKSEKYITKGLGIFLICFGVALAFVKNG